MKKILVPVILTAFFAVGCGRAVYVTVPTNATPEQKKTAEKEARQADATRRSSSRISSWLSSVGLPALLTIVVTNITVVPIEILVNGAPEGAKDASGQWHNFVVMPGGVVSKGFYNYLGMRQIVITARGICPTNLPEVDGKTLGCTPGQPVGTQSRIFTIVTDGYYHVEEFPVTYLQGFRGVY